VGLRGFKPTAIAALCDLELHRRLRDSLARSRRSSAEHLPLAGPPLDIGARGKDLRHHLSFPSQKAT
jgi:hypothetical protein